MGWRSKTYELNKITVGDTAKQREASDETFNDVTIDNNPRKATNGELGKAGEAESI